MSAAHELGWDRLEVDMEAPMVLRCACGRQYMEGEGCAYCEQPEQNEPSAEEIERSVRFQHSHWLRVARWRQEDGERYSAAARFESGLNDDAAMALQRMAEVEYADARAAYSSACSYGRMLGHE